MSTDSELIRLSLDQPSAFGELYARHARAVYRYAASRVGAEGAEDVLSNTFLAAFERRKRFDTTVASALPWLTDNATLANLLKFDSITGRLDATVELDGDNIVVNGKAIKVFEERDPANLPWGELGVDIVIESTGFFTKAADAQKHIDAGAKKVIISAPRHR